MIPGVLFGLCWCCDFFARAICRGPLGWKFLIEKSQLRWFPNFSRPWCSTTRRMWWGQPYHPLKSVRRDIFVFDLRYLRKQEPQEGVFKMILRIIWETKIRIHNEFDCMEIEFGFIRSLPLKCCHSPPVSGSGVYGITRLPSMGNDGSQDTSDPKKVVLDMRSEHFVEALPLWLGPPKRDVRDLRIYCSDVWRDNVTAPKDP